MPINVNFLERTSRRTGCTPFCKQTLPEERKRDEDLSGLLLVRHMFGDNVSNPPKYFSREAHGLSQEGCGKDVFLLIASY